MWNKSVNEFRVWIIVHHKNTREMHFPVFHESHKTFYNKAALWKSYSLKIKCFSNFILIILCFCLHFFSNFFRFQADFQPAWANYRHLVGWRLGLNEKCRKAAKFRRLSHLYTWFIPGNKLYLTDQNRSILFMSRKQYAFLKSFHLITLTVPFIKRVYLLSLS